MSKKCFQRVTLIVVVCLMLCGLTACATTLNGTYTSKDSLLEYQFTFMDDNKVKMSAFGVNIEGEYLIEDGEITITYGILGLSYDWVKSFEKDGNSIFIDGVEFVKEK